MVVWRRIVAHFEALRTLDRWPFFWRITLEGLTVPFLLVQFIGLFIPWPPLESLHDKDIKKYLFLAVVAGPLWELILWQWLPVMIARHLGGRFWMQVLVSQVVFFLPHIGNGVRGAIGGGLLAGFYTVFTYVVWRERSLWTACYMTYFRHALHNLVVVSVWWFAVT